MSGPPDRLRRLLGLLIPPGERRALLGDLNELYRARADRDGRGAADAWYRRQLGAFLRARIAGRLGSGTTPAVRTDP